MAILRHWKQQFDLTADFVYLRRMRIGEGTDPWVEKGSDVDNKAIGAARLRRFWDIGWIELKDYVAPRSHGARIADDKARIAKAVEDMAPAEIIAQPTKKKPKKRKAKKKKTTE